MMCVIGQFRSLLLAVWFPASKYSPGVTHPEYIAQPAYHGMRHLAYSWLKKEADRCHENVFVFNLYGPKCYPHAYENGESIGLKYISNDFH